MKKPIRIAAVIIAAALCAVLFAACSDNSKADKASSSSGSSAVEKNDKTSAAGEPVSKTFGWVKFDVPAGYTPDDSGEYVVVINENDKNKKVNVARDLFAPDNSIDEVVEKQISNDSGKYSKGDDAPFGDRMWKTVKYQENGAENRMYFAPAGDGKYYLRVSTFGLTENDEDVKTILASLTLL